MAEQIQTHGFFQFKMNVGKDVPSLVNDFCEVILFVFALIVFILVKQ